MEPLTPTGAALQRHGCFVTLAYIYHLLLVLRQPSGHKSFLSSGFSPLIHSQDISVTKMWLAFPPQAVCLTGPYHSIVRYVKPDCISSSSCPRALGLCKRHSHALLFFRFYESFRVNPFILSGIPSSASLTPLIHAHVYAHSCTHRTVLVINFYWSPKNPVKCHFPLESWPHLPSERNQERKSLLIFCAARHCIYTCSLSFARTYCIYLFPHWLAGDLSIESIFHLCVFGTRWSVFRIVGIKRKNSKGWILKNTISTPQTMNI